VGGLYGINGVHCAMNPTAPEIRPDTRPDTRADTRADTRPDTERWRGRGVLLLAHVAGMIDLVALPVWVGAALIGQYHFSPTQAGAMVTAYLAAVVLASLIFAPRFHRHSPRRAATAGYALAALAFAAVPQASGWGAMAGLHALAGFGAGVGLSFTHGTIGRSARPHRLFAFVNMGLGLLAIGFLGAAQALIPQLGGGLLFNIFAVLMALAATASALAFPRGAAVGSPGQAATQRAMAMAPPVWWAIAGITLMTVCQSMFFSFVERIGIERGFGDRVVGVLIALGFVNLLPPVLAAWLERRLPALRVGMVGVCTQAALALTVTLTTAFGPYAAAASVFVAVQIFTHTFIFGWLAQHDRSGRAVALTPAMLMSGAAIGPLLGGVLTSAWGVGSLGFAVLAVDGVALACFARALSASRAAGHPAMAAAAQARPAH